MQSVLASNFPVWFGYWYYFCLFFPFYFPAIVSLRFLVKFRAFLLLSKMNQKKRLVALAIWWGGATLVYATLWQSVMNW